MKAKSPAYQRYPKDYLSDFNVQIMTLEEEGAYNRLLDICWLEGFLPNDDEALSKVCKNCSLDIIRVVKKCFEPKPNDPSKLVHARLEKERVKQSAWSLKSQEGGKKSAEARAAKKSNVPPPPKTDAKPANASYDSFKELFDQSRKLYPGTKKGLDTEFKILTKHTDWRDVLKVLEDRILKQIEARNQKLARKEFAPEWKHFSTWLNQRCWEEETAVQFSSETNSMVYKGSIMDKIKNQNARD